MKIFYRISDGSYKKERFEHATKKGCLENFLKHFPADEIIIYADNVKDDTYDWINTYGLTVVRTNGGSSAAGFRHVFDAALQIQNNNEIVYFVEDDYLHLPNSHRILIEGLERADYVTLYDCVDKYIPGSLGGNPFIDDAASEETRVFLTKNRHWKLTNSTTMTFASTVGTLREDETEWRKYTSGTYPHDFKCFIELRQKGRTLASPIPSLSTHCEPMWAAPLIDWNSVN
jgi:glycosyltransferase involved in cell wall biosynthesis